MNNPEIIIIGAGAAGLMAAYTLVKAGTSVTVLEARNRIGGRIHTLTGGGFSMPVELGAEFVHGDLPITLDLLREAGIGTTRVGFEMWHYDDGKFEQSEEFVEGWDAFLEKLAQLEHDMPIMDFIGQNFSGEEYARMRSQIENYVSGYDTADVHDAGAFALRNEWHHEDEDAQHRVNGGYGSLMNFLADTIQDAGSDIFTDTVVRELIWENSTVKVVTKEGMLFEARKAIIALPLGVLQAPKDAEGTMVINPPLDVKGQALHDIGFGAVIKILLEFDGIFWARDLMHPGLSNMGFLFSEEAIPTYWTQSPAHSPLLTGWLGGPPAYAHKDTSAEAILQIALNSLGNIFKMEPNILKAKLVAWHVANWTADPHTRGSYAYDKVKSPEARKVLQQPAGDTLYFAGEYLYDGPAMGTVEAALTSGRDAAKMALEGQKLSCHDKKNAGPTEPGI